MMLFIRLSHYLIVSYNIDGMYSLENNSLGYFYVIIRNDSLSQCIA